jgi:hypothetical protein
MVERVGIISWLQRRAERDESDARGMGLDEGNGPDLMVEVVGPQGSRVVRMETNGRRVSDVVNHADQLSVLPVSGPDEADETAFEPLDLDEALILVPPRQAGDPRHRLHRPGHPVRIVVGPYEVVGDAHTPPGTQAVGFLLRMWPRFVPLTAASLRLTSDPEYSRRVPVAIVNLAQAKLLRDVPVEG